MFIFSVRDALFVIFVDFMVFVIFELFMRGALLCARDEGAQKLVGVSVKLGESISSQVFSDSVHVLVLLEWAHSFGRLLRLCEL